MAGVVGLAKQVIESRNRGEKAQAVLKLFATLGQAKWVTQQGLMEEWTAIYLGILQVCPCLFQRCPGLLE